MKKNNHAFTLMEILLVAVLMATVAIAVTQAFTNGLRLWVRSQQLVVESNLMIFFDKFGEDARGLLPISTLAFKGSSTQVSWPTTVIGPADLHSSRAQEGVVDQIGVVQYRYDAANKKIYRRQANYAQSLKGQWGVEIEVAANVEEVLFHYDLPSAKGFDRKPEVDGSIPLGISVELGFVGAGHAQRLRRFFPIAVGGGL